MSRCFNKSFFPGLYVSRYVKSRVVCSVSVGIMTKDSSRQLSCCCGYFILIEISAVTRTKLDKHAWFYVSLEPHQQLGHTPGLDEPKPEFYEFSLKSFSGGAERWRRWPSRSLFCGLRGLRWQAFSQVWGAWVFVSVLINVFVVHSRTAGSLAGHGHHMAYFLLRFQRL